MDDVCRESDCEQAAKPLKKPVQNIRSSVPHRDGLGSDCRGRKTLARHSNKWRVASHLLLWVNDDIFGVVSSECILG